MVPQLSLRGLGSGRQKDEAAAEELPLARFVFRDVTWISRRGIAVVYDGEVDFDPGWRPRKAELRRPGFKPATGSGAGPPGPGGPLGRAHPCGRGTADGDVRLDFRAGGRMHLEGELQPKDVEVESMLAAFNRRSIIGGKASGDTTLSANGDTVGELAPLSAHQTPFSIGKSTLLRFDLDKAVRTAGKEHDGQTPLDSVTGRLDTRNTPQGMVVTYTGPQGGIGLAHRVGPRPRLPTAGSRPSSPSTWWTALSGVPLARQRPAGQCHVRRAQGCHRGRRGRHGRAAGCGHRHQVRGSARDSGQDLPAPARRSRVRAAAGPRGQASRQGPLNPARGPGPA